MIGTGGEDHGIPRNPTNSTQPLLPSLKLRLSTGQVFRWNVMWKRTGKGWEKTGIGWKRMGNGANIAFTYRYSIDIEQDFVKLDSDPARTRQLQVRHVGKR